MHEPGSVSFTERVTRLAQNMNDSFGRLRPMLRDERIQIETVEKLHDVIERSVWSGAVVVDLDGVRGVQAYRGLDLGLEPREQLFESGSGPIVAANQLDGGGASE